MKINVIVIPSEYKLDHGYAHYWQGKLTRGRQIDPFASEDAISIDLEPMRAPRASYEAQEAIYGAQPLWLREMPRFWEED